MCVCLLVYGQCLCDPCLLTSTHLSIICPTQGDQVLKSCTDELLINIKQSTARSVMVSQSNSNLSFIDFWRGDHYGWLSCETLEAFPFFVCAPSWLSSGQLYRYQIKLWRTKHASKLLACVISHTSFDFEAAKLHAWVYGSTFLSCKCCANLSLSSISVI